jgi:hypothetical protein
LLNSDGEKGTEKKAVGNELNAVQNIMNEQTIDWEKE